MTALCDLAAKYGTDKAWPHRYTPVYHTILNPMRLEVKNVLEIGVCVARDIKNGRTGASLYMWREFFPNANIYGIDIDPASMVRDDRIITALADQTSSGEVRIALEAFGNPVFDLIVDDGSHNPDHQTAAAKILLPYLATDGHYFIEDIYVDPKTIQDALPDHYEYMVFEGGKLLPEGYGRRSWGGPPAGECLMLIR